MFEVIKGNKPFPIRSKWIRFVQGIIVSFTHRFTSPMVLLESLIPCFVLTLLLVCRITGLTTNIGYKTYYEVIDDFRDAMFTGKTPF